MRDSLYIKNIKYTCIINSPPLSHFIYDRYGSVFSRWNKLQHYDSFRPNRTFWSWKGLDRNHNVYPSCVRYYRTSLHSTPCAQSWLDIQEPLRVVFNRIHHWKDQYVKQRKIFENEKSTPSWQRIYDLLGGLISGFW